MVASGSGAQALSPAEEQRLLERAAEVRRQAYAPYSQFQVGAALLARSGNIYVGCNVENASYGLCICAERHAVGAAVAAGEREFVAIAVVAGTDKPATPCGACRQVLVEFAPSMVVLMATPDNLQQPQRATAADLLPGYFTLGDSK